MFGLRLDMFSDRGTHTSSPKAVRLSLRPTPWFHSSEPSRDAAHQSLDHVMPAGWISAVTCGPRLAFRLHTPTVNGGRIRSA